MDKVQSPIPKKSYYLSDFLKGARDGLLWSVPVGILSCLIQKGYDYTHGQFFNADEAKKLFEAASTSTEQYGLGITIGLADGFLAFSKII